MAALEMWRCPGCGHAVRVRVATEVSHPCPQRRTARGAPKVTRFDKDEDDE